MLSLRKKRERAWEAETHTWGERKRDVDKTGVKNRQQLAHVAMNWSPLTLLRLGFALQEPHSHSVYRRRLCYIHTLSHTLFLLHGDHLQVHTLTLSLFLWHSHDSFVLESLEFRNHMVQLRDLRQERERDSQKTMISISLGRQRQQIQWRRGRNTLRRKCRGDKTTPLAIY